MKITKTIFLLISKYGTFKGTEVKTYARIETISLKKVTKNIKIKNIGMYRYVTCKTKQGPI